MKIKTRRYYLYYLAKIAIFFLSKIPLQTENYVAKLLGGVSYIFLKKYRKIAVKNLRSAFPEKNDKAINRIAKGVFTNLAKVGIEIVNFPRLSDSKIINLVKPEGLDIIDDILKNKKGAIMLTAHFGNWELISAFLIAIGYYGSAVGRKIYFSKYDKIINRIRRSRKVPVIYRDESPKKMFRILKQNAILGMLADQDIDSVDGIFVNFFGRPTYTPTGPANLSLASGAPIIPVLIVREGGKFKLCIERPIFLDRNKEKRREIYNAMQEWSNKVENYIRKYPEQWVWLHERWKTQ